MNLKFVYTFVGVAVISVVATLSLWRTSQQPADPPTVSEPSEQMLPDLVALSTEQVRRANIKTSVASEIAFQPTRTVPGRLSYDQDRHVAVKAAFNGVVTEFRVRPGDTVAAGQTLAVLSSPEVGAARAKLKRRQADLQLAQRQTEWQTKIRDGVTLLVKLIREEKEPQEIDSALQYQTVGDYRERLVSAYTRVRLANVMADNIREAAASGAVSGKVRQERESERQAAQAALQSAIEQSIFDIEQLSREATAKSDDATRQLEVSQQDLKLLLGPSSRTIDVEISEASPETSLSQVEVVAPINGAMEERNLAVTERVSAGDPIAVIADTRHLWAVAEIREQDWATIDVDVGTEVVVTTPALPDERYAAEVLVVGRSVDATTGAASLVAQLESEDHRLRPGLFVRVTIPAGPSRAAVTVPESAVVMHDGQSFVFVSEGPTRFRRVDVQPGKQEGGQIEVLAGLAKETPVVTEGAFFLKSVLLMVGQDE